jgi:tRNA(fMet)-specific endonuclease VapC
MPVLDTDILSILQTGRGPEADRIRTRLRASGERERVTIVSFEEQMRGWLNYIAGADTLEKQIGAYARLRGMLDDFRGRDVLDFDAAAAAEFARLKSAKFRISTSDLRIAAIALAHGATLITKNLSHFRKVPRLRAEDWSAANRADS